MWSLLINWGLGERGETGVLTPPQGDVLGVIVPEAIDSVSGWGVGVADSSQKVSGGAMMLESSSSPFATDTPSWEVRETRSAGGRPEGLVHVWWASIRPLLVLLIFSSRSLSASVARSALSLTPL